MEIHRWTISPKNVKHQKLTELDNEYDDANHDNHLISYFVKLVTEVDMGEVELGGMLCNIKATSRKSKSSYSKKSSRYMKNVKSLLNQNSLTMNKR